MSPPSADPRDERRGTRVASAAGRPLHGGVRVRVSIGAIVVRVRRSVPQEGGRPIHSRLFITTPGVIHPTKNIVHKVKAVAFELGRIKKVSNL